MNLDIDFTRWKDDLTTNKFYFLLIATLLMFLWLSQSNLGQANTQLSVTIGLFLGAAILTTMAFLVSRISPQNKYVAFLGLGENFGAFAIALGAGATLAYVIGSASGFSIANFSSGSVNIAALSSLMALVLVRYVSPLGEESFFASFLQPTLVMHFGGIQGTLINAGLFALGHFLAYGGDLSQMIGAFVFRVVVSYGNQYFDSVGFGLGAHFVYNGL